MTIDEYNLYLIGNGNLANSLAAHFRKYKIKFDWFKSSEQKRYFNYSDELEDRTIYLLAVNESNLLKLVHEFHQKGGF